MEAKAWQAFYATLLLERSKFGLNELLDEGPDSTGSPAALTPLARLPANPGAEDAANQRGVASAGVWPKPGAPSALQICERTA